MRKETKLWFDLAEEDFRNMGLMVKAKSHRASVFFAQQAVEKLLKAYIIEFKKAVPKRTHKIEILMKDTRLKMEGIKESELEELSKAYTWVRYPDLAKRFYTKKEITKELLVTTRKLYLWIKDKFKKH